MAADEQGRAVAEQAIAVARAIFRDRLTAAYLIGSLAHGGFVASVSDVDVALILDRHDSGDAARVLDVTRRVQGRDDCVLASRLSVFWTDEPGLRGGQPAGRLPAIDWLDLADHGELVYGHPLSAFPGPTAAQLVEESASFAVRKWRQDPDWARQLRDGADLVRQGRRAATKAALFPVRFLYTLGTGRAGSTDDAVDWYRANRNHPSQQLVRAAHDWRTHGFDDPTAAADLLNNQLLPLYREFESAYRPRLLEQHLPDLARALADTIARLE